MFPYSLMGPDPRVSHQASAPFRTQQQQWTCCITMAHRPHQQSINQSPGYMVLQLFSPVQATTFHLAIAMCVGFLSPSMFLWGCAFDTRHMWSEGDHKLVFFSLYVGSGGGAQVASWRQHIYLSSGFLSQCLGTEISLMHFLIWDRTGRSKNTSVSSSGIKPGPGRLLLAQTVLSFALMSFSSWLGTVFHILATLHFFNQLLKNFPRLQ